MSLILTSFFFSFLAKSVSDQLVREVEADLEKTIDFVQISVTFLRDFPLEELLAASNLQPQLTRAISSALQHFSKLRHSKYDLSRASSLIESLGATVNDKVLTILREKNLMLCSMSEFKRIKDDTDVVFQTWDTQFVNQRQVRSA